MTRRGEGEWLKYSRRMEPPNGRLVNNQNETQIMPAFRTSLQLEKTGPQRWMLLQDLAYDSGVLGGLVVVRAGVETDLASVPWWGQWLISKVGRYDGAAVLHDAAYRGQLCGADGTVLRVPKDVADRLLAEAARVGGVKPRTATALYWCVRLGGRVA